MAAQGLRSIVTILETYEGMEAIGKALDYCIRQELYSVGDFRMAVEYFVQTGRPEAEKNGKATVPENTGACIRRCAAWKNTYRRRRDDAWRQKQKPSKARL